MPYTLLNKIKNMDPDFEINERYIIIYYTKKKYSAIYQFAIITGTYEKTIIEYNENKVKHFACITNVKDMFYKGRMNNTKFDLSQPTSFYKRDFNKNLQQKMEEKSLKKILQNLLGPHFRHYLFDDYHEIYCKEIDINYNNCT